MGAAVNSEVGRLIGDACRRAGLSAAQLAREAGVHQPSLAAVIKGTRPTLSEENLTKIASRLGIDPRQLLLAGARARIENQELRQAIPPGLDHISPGADFEAARRVQRRRFFFEAASVAVGATIEPNGDINMVRRYAGLRLTEHAKDKHVEFWERSGGPHPLSQHGGVSVMQDERTGVFKVETFRRDKFTVHRISPESGIWPSTGISCTHATVAHNVFGKNREPRGLFQFYLHTHIDRLDITLSLPLGYQASDWKLAAVFGQDGWAPGMEDLLPLGICTDHDFNSEPGRAVFWADNPLAGHLFAFSWIEDPNWRDKK